MNQSSILTQRVSNAYWRHVQRESDYARKVAEEFGEKAGAGIACVADPINNSLHDALADRAVMNARIAWHYAQQVIDLAIYIPV